MNRKMIKNIFLMLVMLLPFTITAQNTYQIKSHEITIEGTSNLQSWTADVEKVDGSFNVKLQDNKIVGISEARLNIDATSISGSEGRRMNSKIYESLDTRNHPSISFNLRDINSLAENPGTARVNASGVITVAGVSQLVTLNTVGKVLPNGELEFSGSQVIKMSDHGISAPTALLGALRTGDEVTVVYRIILNSK